MSDFFRNLARARFLGHPVHAMLVHFPAALFPFGAGMDSLGLVLGNTSFSTAACYAYAGGVVLGGGAAIAGAIDYFRIPTDGRAWKTASVHALLNLVWLSVFTFICGMRIDRYPQIALPTTIQLVTVVVCVFGMMVSNYLGGELVFRHGLGVSEEAGGGKAARRGRQ